MANKFFKRRSLPLAKERFFRDHHSERLFGRTEGQMLEVKRISAEFDDCPICQAEKQAQAMGRNATMAELKEVFRKAKDQGAIVGGPLVVLGG